MTSAQKNSAEKTATFFPSASFTGYPGGEKTKFLAGVESAPVPASYLDVLRAKGLVSETAITTKEGKPETDEQSEADEPEG